jgi:hypothetical protein
MTEDRVQKKGEGNPESATEPHAERSSAQVVCPVVGIGASAGGLEAFTRLLEHLPATTGMAYIFIQHLDPTHASLLPSLLARVTSMPVREIRAGMSVEANQVYVLPPNAILALAQGTFTLGPLLAPSAERFAIDHFLRSLARTRTSRDWRAAFGNRLRWHTRSPGHQGRGRPHLRARCPFRSLPTDASERHCRRCRRSHPPARRDRQGTHLVQPATGSPNSGVSSSFSFKGTPRQ